MPAVDHDESSVTLLRRIRPVDLMQTPQLGPLTRRHSKGRFPIGEMPGLEEDSKSCPITLSSIVKVDANLLNVLS